jgi:hypothetical protein
VTWTSPMTFTTGAVLTAAQMNTFVRDNLLETAPAKATTASGYFVSTGVNAIAERIPMASTVATAQSRNVATYADLATVGPSVTVVTGTKAVVSISAAMWNETTDSAAAASFAVSGATTISAIDDRKIWLDGIAGSNKFHIGATYMVESLNPGTNTFTMKYRSGGTTIAWFEMRHLVVLPL